MTDGGPDITGAGSRYHVSGRDDARARRLAAADKPGEHLWVMVATWRTTDPQGWSTGAALILDAENLLVLAGPGCYKCEQQWSRHVAARICRGSLDGPGERQKI